MNDCISRKAAIDAVDVKNVNKGIVSALQSIIEELPSVQQWTPVSEGLPEKEVEVLVTTSWGNVCMAWCDNGKWRAEYINGYDDDEILAWMPLPEPYKERREE